MTVWRMHADDGATSSVKIFANIFISFIGAGILGMPHAFKEAGIIEGSAIMGLIGTLSVKAMLLIIDCKKKITWKKFDHLQNGAVVLSEGKVTLEEKGLLKLEENEEGWEKVNDELQNPNHDIDYGDLGYYAFGHSGRVVVDLSIVISQIGKSCSVDPLHQFLMSLLPPLAILVNFRHLKKLAIFSLFADFANVFAYCVVFWFDFSHFEHVKIHPQVARISGLPFFLGVAIYCYECIEGDIIPCHIAVHSIWGLRLSGPFPEIVQLCLCFSLFFTYPIMMFPVVLLLERKFLPDGGKSSYYVGSVLRACVVLLSGIVVLCIPNFSTLMAFFGSSCCTLLGFILPGIFHLRIFEGHLTKFEWLVDITLIFLGLVGALIGTRDALLRLLAGT
ncbi:Amino acid transporter AVT3C [Acropora cervicornis]|uniref:Amino acid transporter AVT3C n=1 Tax=Acropora cervicornis TaxID=6130 RepID=A0AAD9QVH6_ACRCE|nr:Amino acid transporter AVT3C [Acropora cervicornis]